MRTLLVVLLALPLAAQISVTPQRIAGVPASEWPSGDGGLAVDAPLTPTALAFDASGLLIADSRSGHIRRIGADGKISTVLDAQAFVAAMAADRRGNLYVVRIGELPLLVQVSPAGESTVLQRLASAALAVDASDNVYFVGVDGYVSKRSPEGAVQKVSREALPGTNALAFDAGGSLLVGGSSGLGRLQTDGRLVHLADGQVTRLANGGNYLLLNGDEQIWNWDSKNGLTVFAGENEIGFNDGCAKSSGLRVAKYASLSPADLALDASGQVYLADRTGRVRRIDSDGSIRTIAGTGSQPRESGAILYGPREIAVDGFGNVFFTEYAAGHVHELTSDGRLFLVAGAGSPPAGEDAACYTPLRTDVLVQPSGLSVDRSGNLYIADTGNHRILRRTVDGTISTVTAEFSRPTAVAVDPGGNIFVIDGVRLKRIGKDTTIETVETPTLPDAIAFDSNGRMILNSTYLYKEDANGRLYPLVVSKGGSIAIDSTGAIFTHFEVIRRISANCHIDTLLGPQVVGGIATDRADNVYYSQDGSIWRIPAIGLFGEDLPSVQLDDPGVFNAASNLSITQALTNPKNPFHITYVQVNDSIAANEMVRIKGACLGSLAPTANAGSKVLVDGVEARVLSTQSTEILAVMPEGLPPTGKLNLTIEYLAARTTVALDASAAAPGIFVSANTRAAAINEDGSLNGFEHPARVGSIVSLFATGTGQPGTPVVVRVGGQNAEVVFMGAAPGLVGITQINIRIPKLPPSDVARVELTAGGLSRNQQVTLAVQ